MKNQKKIGSLNFTLSGIVFGFLCIALAIYVKFEDAFTAPLQNISKHSPNLYFIASLPVLLVATLYFVGWKRERVLFSIKDTVKGIWQERNLHSEEKRRFEQTMQMAKLGTWETDNTNNSIYLSQELRNIYHLSQNRNVSIEDLYKNVHEDDIAFVKERIQLCASSLQQVSSEYRYLINGEVHYMLSNIAPKINEDGKLYGYFGTVQDITASKQTELALKKTKEENVAVLNNTQTLICTHDMNGIMLDVNETGARMCGYSKDELIGMNFNLLIPNEYQSQYADYLNTIASTGSANGTLVVKTKDRQKRVWLYHNTVYNANGNAPYIIASAIDITESVKAKNELEKQQQIIRQIIDNSPNVICVLDEKNQIVLANKTFSDYYKYDSNNVLLATELIKGDNDIFLGNEDSIQNLNDGDTITNEGCLQNIKDDSTHWFTIFKKCFKEKNGKKYFLCFGMDITQRYHAEKELKTANQMVERSLKVKDQFISNMSHEIRTPLNAVIGFTDLLSDTSLTKEQGNYIEIVKTASQTLLALINNILDLSKLESGNLSLEVLPIDVKQIIKNITRIFEPKAKIKNIQISTNIADNIPSKVLGDQLRLSQIIFNLLGNAVKFTEAGNIDIKCSLVKGPDRNKHYISFSIKDTGIGVPAEKQNDIFERFTQANTDTQRLYGGSGLGLNIVKSIVDMYGGTLNMESEVDKGTEFNFILPFKRYIEPIEIAEEQTADSNNTQPVSLQQPKNILLAEDNLINALLAKEVLRKRGFNVHHVTNGVLAVEAVQQHHFDVVLMDIQMPEMNGIAATGNIRKLSGSVSEIPIIAMTAHSLNGEMQNCYKAGMNGYVSKPFKPDDLCAAIMDCINNAQEKICN